MDFFSNVRYYQNPTFVNECIKNAEDSLEAWACKNPILYLRYIASKGIFTEMVIIIAAFIVLLIVIFFRRFLLLFNKPEKF